MPRQPDPQLEIRILKAAQKLFLTGGEKGLSARLSEGSAHQYSGGLSPVQKQEADPGSVGSTNSTGFIRCAGALWRQIPIPSPTTHLSGKARVGPGRSRSHGPKATAL